MAEHARRLTSTGRWPVTTGIALTSACLLAPSVPADLPDLADRAARAAAESRAALSAETTLLASSTPLPNTVPEMVEWLTTGFADWPEPEFLPGVLDALNQRLQILLDELEAKPNLTSDFQQSMLEKFEAYEDQLGSPDTIDDILNAYKDGLGLRQPTSPFATAATPGPTLATMQAGPTGIPFIDDLITGFFEDLKPLEDLYKSAEETFNLQVGTMPALVKWVEDGFPITPDLHPGVKKILEQTLSIAPGAYDELMAIAEDGYDPNRYTIPESLALAEKILALEPGQLTRLMEQLNEGFELQPDMLQAVLQVFEDGLTVQPDPLERAGQIVEDGFTILPGGTELVLEQLTSSDFWTDLALDVAINTLLGTWYQGVATVFRGAADLVFGPDSIPSEFLGGFGARGINGAIVAVLLIPVDAVVTSQSIPSEFMRGYLAGGFRGLIGQALVFYGDLFDAANAAEAAGLTLNDTEAIAQLVAAQREASAATDAMSASLRASATAGLVGDTSNLRVGEVADPVTQAVDETTAQLGNETTTEAGDEDVTALNDEQTTEEADDQEADARDSTAQPGDATAETGGGNKVEPGTTAGTTPDAGTGGEGDKSEPSDSIQGAGDGTGGDAPAVGDGANDGAGGE